MKTQTIKVWKSTLKRLRMLYALTGESMVSILDRITATELERVQADEKATAKTGEIEVIRSQDQSFKKK